MTHDAFPASRPEYPYDWLPDAQQDLIRRGRALAAEMNRLVAGSTDATDLCKSLGGLIRENQIDQALAAIDAWTSTQREIHKGEPFVVGVPEFSALRGGDPPVYHYFGVDEGDILSVDPEAVDYDLYRRYITGTKPLFTSAEQEYMEVAFNPDLIQDASWGETTWEVFNDTLSAIEPRLGITQPQSGIGPVTN